MPHILGQWGQWLDCSLEQYILLLLALPPAEPAEGRVPVTPKILKEALTV